MKSMRKKLGVPEELEFRTKPEIALSLIKRAKGNGLEFEISCFDDLYGRNKKFRSELRKEEIVYMADIPSTTKVYLNEPKLGKALKARKKGEEPKKIKVLSKEQAKEVFLISQDSSTQWYELSIRPTERGELRDKFAEVRVWTVYEDKAVEELLVMRKEKNGKCSYSLCNAPYDTTLSKLAWWKCQRYFIERSNQDAKSELGWDEFQAQKYLGWQHHLALTILASWFTAQTRYKWAQTYERDPELAKEFEVDVLPMLSLANVRSLLSAVMPLHQLTSEQAVDQVIEHLVNRTTSRKSRMKKFLTSNNFP
jgi:SRSO17 transposase